jgi:hypothetical protein
MANGGNGSIKEAGMNESMQTIASLRTWTTMRAGAARILQVLVLALACGVASEAAAQVCCPAGCVQNNNSCVTTGANPRACQTVPCTGGGSSGSSGGSSGGGQTVVQPILPPPGPVCFDVQPTQATINEVTNRCISSLVANAQLIGCLLEDDAGKAEDKRTGLTCAQRQAALARQCNTRCANFAQQITHRVCSTEGFGDEAWFVAFGDLDGKVVGSARVAGCGPRLKTAINIPKSDTFKQKNVPSIKP